MVNDALDDDELPMASSHKFVKTKSSIRDLVLLSGVWCIFIELLTFCTLKLIQIDLTSRLKLRKKTINNFKG